MIGFRHADAQFPFLWETAAQPPARWHAAGEGPRQYLADTPDGAWAEFLRHEEITDPVDLAGIARLWAIEVGDDVVTGAHRAGEPTGTAPTLGAGDLLGDERTYPACQAYARAARADGHHELLAPSAALLPGAARGQQTDTNLLCEAADRDGQVWVLYGRRSNVRAWRVIERGAPPIRVLGLVRHHGA